MQIWSVLSQKGGAGKTTVALHLAIAAMQTGLTVLVIDVDPQQSAAKWANIRGFELDSLSVVSAITPDLPKALTDAARKSVDLVIIDTSPRADRDCIEICRRADFVIVPVRPSVMDIPAVEETMTLIDKAGQRHKSVIVLNAVPSNTSEGQEAGEVLAKIGPLLPVMLGDRVDFRRALTGGQGVTEFAPKSKAAAEVLALYKAIAAKTHLQES
jgi:chromosome partitioning protein